MFIAWKDRWNMNLIIAIISYVLCGFYIKYAKESNNKIVNIIVAVLWMISGIIFTLNFLGNIF